MLSQAERESGRAKVAQNLMIFNALRAEMLRQWEADELARAQESRTVLPAQASPRAPYERNAKTSSNTGATRSAVRGLLRA